MSWLGVGEFVNRVVGLFIAFYLARILGPTWYGIVGAAFAVFSYFAIFVQVGLEPRGIREIARKPEVAPSVFARTTSLRLLLAFCTLGALLAASPLLADALSIPWWLLALYGLGFFPIALSASWVLRGLERMRLVAIAVVAQRILMAVGVVLLVRDPEVDLPFVALVEVAAMALVAGWTIHRLRRLYGRLSYAPGIDQWRPMLREALPVAGSRFLMMIYIHGDILLLSWLAGPAAAGEFLAAHKLVLTLWQLAIIFQLASYAETARLVEGDHKAALALQANVLRYLLVACVPCVVAAVIFAQPIVAFIFGHQYLGASSVLAIMALSLPVSFAAGCLSQLLFAAALPGNVFAGYVFGSTLHVALAVMWIPVHGPAGAAWACLAGESVVLLVLACFVARKFNGLPWQRRLAAPLAAGAVAGLGAYGLSPAGPAIQALIGGALYAGLLPLLGGISRHEFSIALAHLRRGKKRSP